MSFWHAILIIGFGLIFSVYLTLVWGTLENDGIGGFINLHKSLFLIFKRRNEMSEKDEELTVKGIWVGIITIGFGLSFLIITIGCSFDLCKLFYRLVTVDAYSHAIPTAINPIVDKIGDVLSNLNFKGK